MRIRILKWSRTALELLIIQKSCIVALPVDPIEPYSFQLGFPNHLIFLYFIQKYRKIIFYIILIF